MNNKGGCLSSIFSFLGFLSGLASFAANIVTILNGWRIPEVKLGKVSIDVPDIAFPRWMDISDMNFALAAGIYASIMLSYVAWKVSFSTGQFITSVLPSSLLMMWSMTFFRSSPGVILFSLFFCNLWMLAGLATYLPSTNSYEVLYLVIVALPIFLLPTNALILITFKVFTVFRAWMCSLTFSVAAMVILFLISRKLKQPHSHSAA